MLLRIDALIKAALIRGAKGFVIGVGFLFMFVLLFVSACFPDSFTLLSLPHRFFFFSWQELTDISSEWPAAVGVVLLKVVLRICHVVPQSWTMVLSRRIWPTLLLGLDYCLCSDLTRSIRASKSWLPSFLTSLHYVACKNRMPCSFVLSPQPPSPHPVGIFQFKHFCSQKQVRCKIKQSFYNHLSNTCQRFLQLS